MPDTIVKRSGAHEPFHAAKITRAAEAAMRAALESEAMRDGRIFEHPDPVAWASALDALTADVLTRLGEFSEVGVEHVQDAVEAALMDSGAHAAARAFVLYREERAKLRRTRLGAHPLAAVGDYVTVGKYARYRADLGRREVWGEIVDRVEAMHARRYPEERDRIAWAFAMVRDRKVLPSMRTMQFGGAAMEAVHSRGYNCVGGHITRVSAFGEALQMLLGGSGVGYSVQRHHVAQLPPLAMMDRSRVQHHVIADTIDGWGDAMTALVKAAVDGVWIEFAYHEIRPKGAPLKTSGGKAPGHLPLRKALEASRAILLGAQGRHLRPFEVHSILCHGADAVRAGGIRRSAMIAIFSPDDEEMATCKTGDWHPHSPHLSRANNSALILRHDAVREEFSALMHAAREWGEPGFVFADSREYMVNPCVEAGFYPVLEVEAEHLPHLARHGIEANVGDKLPGWQFCNLTSVNVAVCEHRREFYEACRAAAYIGTLQAGYTDFPYLGPVTELITRRDALIGVSLVGVMDRPEIGLDPQILELGARIVLHTNEDAAHRIGINPAARTTLAKPEGTSSLALGCIGSGVNPHHARRYFRRVRAGVNEPHHRHFAAQNPHMVDHIGPEGLDAVTFCVETPEGALTLADMTAVGFLEHVRTVQRHWVGTGTRHDHHSPGLTHNVSNTASIAPDEWEGVEDFLWHHREDFAGVSFMPAGGDKEYLFAPREEVVTAEDEARWNRLVEGYTPVDWRGFCEDEDATDLQGEIACAGGKCDL